MNDYGYGLWLLVAVNTAVVLLFAASFFHPKSSRDWRAFGTFSGFVVALFTEMYGAPLTVYLLSSWLGNSVLGLDLTHDGGHLWTQLVGWQGDPHVSPFHLASYALLIGGFWMIAAAWRSLYEAARSAELATRGLYARVRHPQYTGFMAIMVGFLLQWPTIPTLLMFPALVVVYRRLAMAEERETAERFGASWHTYASLTPRFLPRLRRRDVLTGHARQEVTVLVNGSYTPEVIEARAGRPLRLSFRREESSPCTEMVVFPDFDRAAQLPQGTTVPIDLLPQTPGEYGFCCRMGVVRGRLVVR